MQSQEVEQMLRSMKEIQGYKIQAVDGEIGKVDEFYFDDQTWTVRYMVVDTGPWILGRKVLISPITLFEPKWASRKIAVMLTHEEVKESPDIKIDQPVSLQDEIVLRKYYEWPNYWVNPSAMPTPAMIPSYYPPEAPMMEERAVVIHGQGGDPHLRRTREVAGYHIDARDGGIGHVDDFIMRVARRPWSGSGCRKGGARRSPRSRSSSAPARRRRSAPAARW